MTKTYSANYTNKYGEEWTFTYFYTNNTAILKGSDVDWNEYKVVKGIAWGLNLDKDEIEWLRRVWKEAVAKGK